MRLKMLLSHELAIIMRLKMLLSHVLAIIIDTLLLDYSMVNMMVVLLDSLQGMRARGGCYPIPFKEWGHGVVLPDPLRGMGARGGATRSLLRDGSAEWCYPMPFEGCGEIPRSATVWPHPKVWTRGQKWKK